MEIEVPSYANGGRIPAEFAFCVPADEGHVTGGPNRSPHVRWTQVPRGAMSLAIIMHDPDVPSIPDDVNQEGRTIPHSLPRVDFYHWILVDIPPDITQLPAALDSDGVTPRGKASGKVDYGVRGVNNYTDWFAGDPDMEGVYGGYDGPCPPWNDERLHHYHITLYALDVGTLGLHDNFGGPDAQSKMEGHIVARASWTGSYTLNPALGE